MADFDLQNDTSTIPQLVECDMGNASTDYEPFVWVPPPPYVPPIIDILNISARWLSQSLLTQVFLVLFILASRRVPPALRLSYRALTATLALAICGQALGEASNYGWGWDLFQQRNGVVWSYTGRLVSLGINATSLLEWPLFATALLLFSRALRGVVVPGRSKSRWCSTLSTLITGALLAVNVLPACAVLALRVRWMHHDSLRYYSWVNDWTRYAYVLEYSPEVKALLCLELLRQFAHTKRAIRSSDQTLNKIANRSILFTTLLVLSYSIAIFGNWYGPVLHYTHPENYIWINWYGYYDLSKVVAKMVSYALLAGFAWEENTAWEELSWEELDIGAGPSEREKI